VSLPTAVADKLRRSRVDLVVKAAYSSQLGRNQHGSIDWPLVESCAAPILLTRGRPWHPVPRFAAALDLQDREGGALRSAITAIGDSLSRSCGAQLEAIFANARPDSEREAEELIAGGNAIAQKLRLDTRRLRYLYGEPSEVLPRFVAHCDYDLVVMGKPRHGGPAERPRSVAVRVVKATAGDVLFAHPVAESTRRQVRGQAGTTISAGSGARRRREL
jgi:nucleotide-binding universal stress UspA family protein